MRAPKGTDDAAHALIEAGQAERVSERLPNHPALIARALIALGRAVEIQDEHHDSRALCADAHLAAGDPGDVLEDYSDQAGPRARALLQLGRLDKVLAGQHPEAELRFHRLAWELKGLRLYTKGLKKKAHAMFAKADGIPLDHRFEENAFAGYLLKPLLAAFEGKRAALQETCDHIQLEMKHVFCQKLWHLSSYLAGTITEEEFLQQPSRYQLQGRLLLAKALKADLAGQETALALYRQYAALPHHEKPWDPARDRTVRWRVKVLRAGK